MKITLKNLGVFKQAEFEVGELTIICGGNNTGKTYATYAYYGFLSFWWERFYPTIKKQHLDQLLETGVVSIELNEYRDAAKEIIGEACVAYKKLLPNVFGSSKERFESTEFHLTCDPKEIDFTTESYEANFFPQRFSITKESASTKLSVTLLRDKEESRLLREIIGRFIGESIKIILFKKLIPTPFIASAERTGAAIFRRELNFSRNRLLEELGQLDEKTDPFSLIFKRYEGYPLPVQENVSFMRDLESIAKRKSVIAEDHPAILENFSDIIGGSYLVTRDDQLYYQPHGKKIKLALDESSSSVRSLVDIGFYLKHIAKPGDVLMVDEPELNLHPENQRRVARLFARLVNLGINVFITTHSDYIVRELSTLIMLNQDIPYLKKIATQEKYQQEELLTPSQVRLYIAEKASIKVEGNQRKGNYQTLTSAKIDFEFGIEDRSFNTTIAEMNRIQEAIIWGADE